MCSVKKIVNARLLVFPRIDKIYTVIINDVIWVKSTYRNDCLKIQL